MAVETWDNEFYLLARFALWTSVWGASLFDFIKHKGEKVTGWQLHRAIFAVLCLQVVKDLMGMIWQFAFTDGTKASSIFYYGVIFFYDAADAAFFALLMVIAYGWKVTRTSFGPVGGFPPNEAQPILVAPILNFISILVHDVIWERAGGHHGACYIRLKDFESDIMLIATLTYLFTIIYIWMWIFQAVKIEKIRLEEKMYIGKVAPGAANPEAGAIEAPSPTPYTPSTANAVLDGSIGDEAGDIGRQTTASAANQEEEEDLDLKIPDTNFTENAADEDDTAMPLLSKYRLLMYAMLGSPFIGPDFKRKIFFNAVSAFFTAICAVIVCQVWTTKCVFTDEGYTIAVTGARIALLVVRDLIYIGFSAALAYIFRLRESNPYYMLDDYNTNLFDDDDNEGEIQLENVRISTIG